MSKQNFTKPFVAITVFKPHYCVPIILMFIMIEIDEKRSGSMRIKCRSSSLDKDLYYMVILQQS